MSGIEVLIQRKYHFANRKKMFPPSHQSPHKQCWHAFLFIINGNGVYDEDVNFQLFKIDKKPLWGWKGKSYHFKNCIQYNYDVGAQSIHHHHKKHVAQRAAAAAAGNVYSVTITEWRHCSVMITDSVDNYILYVTIADCPFFTWLDSLSQQHYSFSRGFFHGIWERDCVMAYPAKI